MADSTPLFKVVPTNEVIDKNFKDWASSLQEHFDKVEKDYQEHYSSPTYRSSSKEDQKPTLDPELSTELFTKEDLEKKYNDSILKPGESNAGAASAYKKQLGYIKADSRAFRIRHCSVPNILIHGNLVMQHVINQEDVYGNITNMLTESINNTNTSIREKVADDKEE